MRQAVMREAARRGDTADVQSSSAREAAARDFEAAERAYRQAIRLRPDFIAAHVELGLLLETQNKIEDLAALVEEAAAKGLAGAEIGFLRAWTLRRQGRFAEALPLALATPASINPVRRAQLLAEVLDRRGDAGRPCRLQRDEPRRARRAAVADGPAIAARSPHNSALLRPSGRGLEPGRGRYSPRAVFILGFRGRARPCSTRC